MHPLPRHRRHACSRALPAGPAQEGGLAKPDLVLQQIVEGLPSDAKQAVRVLTATFKPGDKTVYHSHRFPVTVYVLEGAFTLDLEGRPPITVHAGEAMVEPPNVAMTGHNPSTETDEGRHLLRQHPGHALPRPDVALA